MLLTRTQLRKLNPRPSDSARDAAASASTAAAPEEEWNGLLAAAAASGSATAAGFTRALQQRMESVVLGLPNGSYAQRVQAEYLKELEARAKSAFADKA